MISAKGDFIIRLDSDDMLRPDYAEELSKQLLLYPQAGYAHAAVQQIDQFGNYNKIRRLSRPTGYQDSNAAIKNAVRGFKVAANIIIYRKEALVAVDYSTSSVDFAEDYYLTSSISSAGFGNFYLDKVLSEYRVWEDIGKTRTKRKLVEISGLSRVITDVLEPAYKKRNWSDKPILQLRRSLAIQQSDCLSWDTYSAPEKEELKKAIFELDSSLKVKAVSFLYQKGFGFVMDSYKNIKSSSKLMIKGLYANYRKYISQHFPERT